MLTREIGAPEDEYGEDVVDGKRGLWVVAEFEWTRDGLAILQAKRKATQAPTRPKDPAVQRYPVGD